MVFAKFEERIGRIVRTVRRGCRACTASRTRSGDLHDVKGVGLETFRISNDYRHISSFYEFEGELLGRGRFGETRIVVHRQTQERYACKTISKQALHFATDLDALKREIDFLKLFKGCDSIASFHDVFDDSASVHIILELCTGGELFNKIVERKQFPEHEAAMMMKSILQTVALCHDHYVVHSDLKPENFIFSHIGPGSTLKAIDFGISQFCPEGPKLKDLVGTVSYMAPEVLSRNYSFPADIWSCGVILYLLICGEPPFYGKSKEEVAKAILFWDVDFSFEPWPSVSLSLKRCIKSMLERDPDKRATARDILYSDWMREQRAAPLAPLPNALYSKLSDFSKYNLLKRVCLRIIADGLPESDKIALHIIFHQLKGENSQAISVTDFKAALVNKGETVSVANLLQIVRKIRISDTDEISYLDFIAANMRLGQLASTENLEYAFRLIDQDANDYITVDELHTFLAEQCGPQVPSTEELESIMKSVDINGDGYIDFGEFRALMKGSF